MNAPRKGIFARRCPCCGGTGYGEIQLDVDDFRAAACGQCGGDGRDVYDPYAGDTTINLRRYRGRSPTGQLWGAYAHALHTLRQPTLHLLALKEAGYTAQRAMLAMAARCVTRTNELKALCGVAA